MTDVTFTMDELVGMMVAGENDLVMKYIKSLPDGIREDTTDELVKALSNLKSNKRKSQPGKRQRRKSPNRSVSYDQARSQSVLVARGMQRDNDTVEDHFEIGGEIGRGVVSNVYHATNKKGVKVALKKMSRNQFEKGHLHKIRQCYDKALILSHPNVVKLNEYLIFSDYIYSSFEYCTNGTIFEVMNEHGVLSQELTAYCTRDILEGLSFLHSKALIHYEVKCENLLISDNMNILLGDFATSYPKQDLVFAENSQPYWASPEVIEAQHLSHLVDSWSVGCTVIEMITGKPPYYDFKTGVAIFKIMCEPCPPIPAGIHPDLDDFLKQCFMKSHEVRPAASDLIEHEWLTTEQRPESMEEFISMMEQTTSFSYPEIPAEIAISQLRDQIKSITEECTSLQKKVSLLETMHTEKKAEKKRLKKKLN
eukprot:TRINITY_DN4665_c0_g1_i1.p1 TRINITY_DN4665_c0_g1~~TRINITY_DN4665_c0_g1_i1.p1  ORF type:complete len:423 (+),score=71.06 TRINITY_DN4665_c0_g1_i1:17-1285(+)